MRRGFLNQPKSKAKASHDEVPPAQLSPNPLPITVPALPKPPISNNGDALRTNDDVKRWAHKLGETPETIYNRVGTQMARMTDSDFKMVYRNITFKDFQGVTLADAKIHDLIPRRFDTRPPALSNVYMISPAAGKGSGMFATKDIPAGAAILVENPVCIYPSMMSLGMSMSRDDIFKMLFNRLEPDVREKALSLCNSKPADLCGKEEGIVRTNGFGLELAAPKMANSPSTLHSGTFLDLSRCNHSCSPNASRRWDLASYSMTLFATRPITDGEEITIEYTKLAEPRQTRCSRLFEMYHFHCECDSCSLPNDKVSASDAARLELRQWPEKSFRNPVEWYKNLTLPDGYLVDGHRHCIALHEQEGLIDMEYAMHIGELAIVYGMLADAENFRVWGRKALKVLKIMRAPAVVPWEQWLADPRRNFKLWGIRIAEKARR